MIGGELGLFCIDDHILLDKIFMYGPECRKGQGQHLATFQEEIFDTKKYKKRRENAI